MKKMIFCFAVVMATVASVATFANSSHNDLNCKESHNSISVAGKGACRHALCGCKWYVSAGTGGKCVCGHWDYVHN